MIIGLCAFLVLTWIALATVAFLLWKRTYDLRTGYDNAIMVVNASEKSIRGDMTVDVAVNKARFDRIDEKIADLEPKRTVTEKKEDDEPPIRQFSTASGFRKFIEGSGN